MSTDLSHFKDAFFEESQEHLTTIEEDCSSSNNVRGHRPSQPNFPRCAFHQGQQRHVRLHSRLPVHAQNGVGPGSTSQQPDGRDRGSHRSVAAIARLPQDADRCAKSGEAPNDAVVSGLGARLEAERTERLRGGFARRTEFITHHGRPSLYTHLDSPRYLFRRGLDPLSSSKNWESSVP